jgi:hypothetical protein
MKMNRFANMVPQLLLAAATMGLGACESIAQSALRDCAGTGKGECVEFTVRYYASKKVEIVGEATKDVQKCEVGVTCKHLSGAMSDTNTIILLQSNSHKCYRVCTGNYCTDRCPVH